MTRRGSTHFGMKLDTYVSREYRNYDRQCEEWAASLPPEHVIELASDYVAGIKDESTHDAYLEYKKRFPTRQLRPRANKMRPEIAGDSDMINDQQAPITSDEGLNLITLSNAEIELISD